MPDARLGELVEELLHAGAASCVEGDRFTASMRHPEVNAARAALVAHLEAREVELMALMQYAQCDAPSRRVAHWRADPPILADYWRQTARALRDAWDKGGAT